MADEKKGRAVEEIKRYDGKVIGAHWVFLILFIPFLYTGLLLFRDWFEHTYHIHGINYIFPSWEGIETWHVYLGIGVLVVGLVHILMHIGQKEKPILPKNVGADLGANIHNILYIFHMAPSAERGAGEKYKRHQRMTYVATVYCLILSAITGLWLWSGWWEDIGIIMHVIAGLLIVFLSGYRILSLIRRHDAIALRSIFVKGTMPAWYVKKHHFLWYRELKGGYKAPKDPGYEKLLPDDDEAEAVDG